jgi:DNA-binding XRE family transcriptional regulator
MVSLTYSQNDLFQATPNPTVRQRISETQKQFADMVGLTTTSVNAHWWEGGKNRPSLKTVERISKAVKLPVETVVEKMYTRGGNKNE